MLSGPVLCLALRELMVRNITVGSCVGDSSRPRKIVGINPDDVNKLNKWDVFLCLSIFFRRSKF